MGTFTVGKTEIEITKGGLNIVQDSDQIKFVKKIQQITFSGVYAVKNEQEIMFITERAVFRLSPEGLVLTEIAPGIDLQRDVLDKMEFVPIVAGDLKLMDSRLYCEEKMGLCNDSQ
jgi:propionate CoA-transferase